MTTLSSRRQGEPLAEGLSDGIHLYQEKVFVTFLGQISGAEGGQYDNISQAADHCKYQSQQRHIFVSPRNSNPKHETRQSQETEAFIPEEPKEQDMKTCQEI